MDKKRVIIAIAIAIVFVFFVGYGIEVFHKSPKMDKYCPPVYDFRNQSACESANGTWTEYPDNPKPVNGGYCENKPRCYEDFNLIQAKHEKIIFIVSIIIGLIAITFGIILQKDAVSLGILGGGILQIIYGTIRYWNQANDTLKFILLGIVLSVLIWIAYKKLK